MESGTGAELPKFFVPFAVAAASVFESANGMSWVHYHPALLLGGSVGEGGPHPSTQTPMDAAPHPEAPPFWGEEEVECPSGPARPSGRPERVATPQAGATSFSG